MQRLGGSVISIKPSDASLKKGESVQGWFTFIYIYFIVVLGQGNIFHIFILSSFTWKLISARNEIFLQVISSTTKNEFN